jgi:PAS domain-containing protein
LGGAEVKNQQCTEDRFLQDAGSHAMTVIRDDGIHRHLEFRKPRPAGSEYWFQLITYPGELVITGDMGTYVFRRLEDMFEFFRTDRAYNEERGRKLGINLGYWAEKLQAMPRDGVKEFDEERFNSVIRERLVNWMRDKRDRTSKEERRDLWDAVHNEVIHADGKERKEIAAYDFRHTVRNGLKFSFQDLWESNFERYTFHFVWVCYAIAWGIKTYDESKTTNQATTEAESAVTA